MSILSYTKRTPDCLVPKYKTSYCFRLHFQVRHQVISTYIRCNKPERIGYVGPVITLPIIMLFTIIAWCAAKRYSTEGMRNSTQIHSYLCSVQSGKLN